MPNLPTLDATFCWMTPGKKTWPSIEEQAMLVYLLQLWVRISLNRTKCLHQKCFHIQAYASSRNHWNFYRKHTYTAKKKIKGKLIKNPFFFIQTYLICWWLSGTRLLLWTNSFRLCMQGLCLPSRIKEWQCTTTPTTPTCTSTSPNCALQQFGRQLQLLDNLKGVTCDRETHPLHLTRAIQRDEEGKIGEHRIMGWPRQTVDAPKLFQDPSGSPLPSYNPHSKWQQSPAWAGSITATGQAPPLSPPSFSWAVAITLSLHTMAIFPCYIKPKRAYRMQKKPNRNYSSEIYIKKGE